MALQLLFAICAAFWIGATTLHAQVKCASDFQGVDEECIRGNEVKFTELKVKVEKSLVDNIYFFRTQRGNLTKLKVISVVNEDMMSKEDKKRGKKECVVYFEASTFINGRAYIPNSILTIKSQFDVWQADQVALDRGGPNDLSLIREDKGCYLKTIHAKGMFYKKLGATGSFANAMSGTLFYASLGLIALACFLVARSTLEEESKFKAAETLEDADTDKKQQVNDFVLRYSRPFFKRYFTPIVQGMKNKNNLRTKYRRKLANAGLTKDLTPEDFMAFKLFLILGFPVLFIILRVIMEETWPLTLIPILAVVGYFYPDIWVNGRIEKRKEEVIRGMPFIVDMLALSVEAGLDFMAAMQKVIEKAPPSALVEEFETLIRETKIGSSRAEGLRQLSWRVDVLPVNSFCATLIAADSVGASIGPILKQLSAELRVKRSADAEKKGATAATKILFPMILFIMPAVFLAIAAPMIMNFISGGS